MKRLLGNDWTRKIEEINWEGGVAKNFGRTNRPAALAATNAWMAAEYCSCLVTVLAVCATRIAGAAAANPPYIIIRLVG